jgi:hypothetical protein
MGCRHGDDVIGRIPERIALLPNMYYQSRNSEDA